MQLSWLGWDLIHPTCRPATHTARSDLPMDSASATGYAGQGATPEANRNTNPRRRREPENRAEDEPRLPDLRRARNNGIRGPR